MNNRMKALKQIKNERGLLTVDFLFSFVMVMGFSSIMFALALTLVVVEITQYITFAAARTYSAAHVTEVQQRLLSKTKYTQLLNNDVFRPLYTNGWFVISNDPEPYTGRLSNAFPGYQQPGTADPDLFWGVGTPFQAVMLDFRIPFYGSTTDQSDGEGEGFQTFIASYLGREVTTNECLNFTNERWIRIRAMDPSDGGSSGFSGGFAGYSSFTSTNGYFPKADNGC